MSKSVYLDHNATTSLRPQAAMAVTEALGMTGNASSVHRNGRLARRAIENARDAVAQLVGANPNDLIFTGCGTEANNMALRGLAYENLFVSAVEHPSVLSAAEQRQIIPVDAAGVVDLARLKEMLSAASGRTLISVMLANNETGVIQPIKAVVELARGHGALVHCDAIQAAGKIPVDMAALAVDLMSLSAHKIGGPQGVGALIVRPELSVAPLLRGGGQERRLRAGTENVAGIAGFGAAALAAQAELERMAELARWRDAVIEGVRKIADAPVFGESAGRLPNTVCLAMPGVSAETQLMAFDLAGVSVSSGSACSSGKVEASHVLAAMGVDEEAALGAIRVSFGWNSEAGDAARFVEAWGAIFAKSGARSAALASAGSTRAMAG